MSLRGGSGTSWTCRMTAMSEQYVKCALIMKNTISRGGGSRPRGLWRTNAVEFQGVGYVYERLSRVNHACGRGANCERVFDGERCALIATRSIKAGGELLLDYGDESERLLPPQTDATASSARTASRASAP